MSRSISVTYLRNSKSVGFFLAFAVAILGTVVSLEAASEEYQLDLTKETQEKVVIAIPGFSHAGNQTDPNNLGGQAQSILENDLLLSEFFSPVKGESYEDIVRQEGGGKILDYTPWTRLGVQWVVKTEFQINPANNKIVFIFRLYDVVNERFLIGKRYGGGFTFLRRMIHRFADEVVEQLTGKRGVAETRIVFVSEGKENKEVYTVDFDGHNLKKLTRDHSVALTPAWSPDGRKILFTSYIENNPDLVMIDSFSGKWRQSILKLPGLNAAPAWSPDGNKIAIVLSKDGNAEIYVLEKNSNLKRLTRHFNIDTSPSWSPDSSKIVFTSDRSGTAAPQIYIMDADAGDKGEVKRISFGSSYNDNPSWSPDGDKIAFTSRIGKGFQIRVHDLNSGKTEKFTNGSISKEHPSWSPDGRFIIYRQRMTNGEKQLFIQRLGSKNARQLTFLKGGGSSPSWSPYPKK